MNTKTSTSKGRLLSGYVLPALCILIAALASGCLENYGRLNWDPQVATQFQAHESREDFNYYHYGVGNRTFAIAGISDKYSMDSKIWRQVQQDTQNFKDLISRAWINSYYPPYDPQGAHILDPEGNRVGNWYSSLRFVTVRFAENNRIVIITDKPFLGGPSADAGSGDAGERLSHIESNPYFSYQLKAILASN